MLWCQKWENALEEHIDYATQFVTLGWEEMISDDDDVPEAVPLGSMQDTLRVSPSVSLSVCH